MAREITIQPGDELTITIKVDKYIVWWLGEALYPLLEHEGDRIYVMALSEIVGISDVEAVRQANRHARDKGWPERATVDQFRKWLPAILSKLFAQVVHG